MNATFASSFTGISRISDLLLMRYLLPNASPKQVRADIGKLLATELSTSELDEMRAELTSGGFLSKNRRNTFSLTDEGRLSALRSLGLSELPSRMTWTLVVAKYLFPKAAGLSVAAAAKLDTKDKLAAFVIWRKYGLNGGDQSSVKRLLEALACKELGFSEETTLDGLLRTVLSKLIGSEKLLTKDQLAQQLPLFVMGLSMLNAEEARRSLVRDWLRGAITTPHQEEVTQAEPFDLAAFASTVRALAGNSPSEDRFHDNKVFIAAVWRASQREPNFLRLSLSDFKYKLIEANARHLLHLSRADLVQAMDPHQVAESETTHLNATFHFILLEPVRP